MSKRGFTLMEATLALTLLVVGMLSLAGGFSQIVKAQAAVKQKLTAIFLAATKLTELRSLNLSETEQLNGAFDEPFGTYSWQAQFGYGTDNDRIADVWLEVKHKSETKVKLWTQMVIENARQ